jgi:hypothetical protein
VSTDAFADLEAARNAVLGEAERFADALGPLLEPSLWSGFERLTIRQADRAGALDDAARSALDAAVGGAIDAGVAAVLERLASPEIWLSPLTAPHLPARRPYGWPGWMPQWVARLLDRAGPERMELGELDDPSNRIWVAISASARPLDPVLEEFGFRPERRRLGGGSFGVSPRTLPQLDPSGAIGQRWKRYRAAYERMTALVAFEA